MKYSVGVLTSWLTVYFSLLSVGYSSGSEGGPRPTVALRLPYRGLPDKGNVNPYSIGAFEIDGQLRVGRLCGTDWNGDIYIYDPVDSSDTFLQRFDNKGRFRERWNCSTLQLSGVAVTKNGYVWAVGRSMVTISGLPVVVFRKGSRMPVADWRYKLPKSVEKGVQKGLTEYGFQWKDHEEWSVEPPEAGIGQVSLWCMGGPVGAEGSDVRVARILWLLCRPAELLELDMVGGTSKRAIPHLTADGRVCLAEDDFDYRAWTWSNLWLYERGDQRGEAIVNRHRDGDLPWGPELPLGYNRGPTIRVDSKGHTYMIWGRGAKPRYRRSWINGSWKEYPSPASNMDGEFALVVLDSRRRLSALLPWRPIMFEGRNTWITPVPDGRGFYRIEYKEKEAVVYFHPLPGNTTAKSIPDKPAPRRRKR